MTEPIESPVIDAYEAAYYLGLRSAGTLCNWRRQGIGPAYVRIGKNIRYRVVDLDNWMTSRRVNCSAVMTPKRTLRPSVD